TIAANSTICAGASATVTFTGTPNAVITYNVNGGANQTITLNASGTATVTNTYTTTTTFNLISAAVGGTTPCSQPQSGSVTITVVPLPVVTISGSANVCPGGAATITFTGTANAVVTYTVNGGANQTITLNSSGTATIPGNYNATTTFTLVNVAASGSTACQQPQTGTATITVVAPPVVTIIGNATICSGQSATVTFAGTPNATVTYAINGGANQTITLNASGAATIANTYTANTVFSLVSASAAGTTTCNQPQTGTVTITVVAPPVVNLNADQSICLGANANIIFTGTPNALVTYTVNGSANQTITLNSSGTATITNTYTINTTFQLVSVTSPAPTSCTQPANDSMQITVLPLPTATIATSSTTVCEGGNATVTFTGTPNSVVTYTVNGGQNLTVPLNASGTVSATIPFTTTTTLTLVSVTSNSPANCTAPLTGSVTITVVPPPTVTIAANASVCPGESATVTFTGTPNAVITYTVNDGANQTITLDASGMATITNTYTATTTYNLVSAAVGGTPPCSQDQTGSVTITVVPLPVVTISGSTSVCPGGAATITFTGTPDASVTYTVNGGANQTITLNGSGTATITNNYNATTTFALVSVSASGSMPCPQPQTATATITLVPPPVVSVSANVATVCSGDSATVTFTGTPNTVVTYNNGTAETTISIPSSGTISVTSAFAETTTFTLVNVAYPGQGGCNQAATGSVTVTVLPAPTATISANTTICPGGSATVTFTGTPNAVVTYNVNGGAAQTITLNSSGTAVITSTYSATTTYTLISVSGSGTPACPQQLGGSVTITVVQPSVVISGSQSICPNNEATVTFTGTPNATVTYTVNGGVDQTIILDANGIATITQIYTADAEYSLVDITSAGTLSCTQPQTGTVTIAMLLAPTATVSADLTTICEGDVSTVTFSGTPNSTITYMVNGGGQLTLPLGSTGTVSAGIPLEETTVITLLSVTSSGTSPCTSPLTSTVTINVTPAPIAGDDVEDFQICTNSPPQDLFLLLGEDAQPGGVWTPTLASGTGVFDPAVDDAGTYSYTVAGNGPCSEATAEVTVTITTGGNAGIDATTTLCANGSSVDLFTLLGTTAEAGGTWSPTLASGTGVFDPSQDVAGTYTYSVGGSAGCTPDTATVTVIVNAVANAGTDGSETLCAGSAPYDLFTALGGTPQTGGTWTPSLASGTGIFDPSVDVAGTYTYTVTGSAPCANDTSEVTITITSGANAGVDATAILCANGSTTDLFALLGSSAQAGGTWSPALASGTGVFDPSQDVAGTYTYTVGGIAVCTPDTATVTVTINAVADAGADGSVTLCLNSAPYDLFTALGGTPETGGTWSPTLASGTSIFDPAVDAAGTYTYTVIGNAPCANDTATVSVTVNPTPDAGIDGTTSFCSTDAPADLILSLGGTPQSGGTWSPALASGTGIFDPSVDLPGVYTYTVGGNLCSTDTASSTVTVTPAANAGIDGTLAACENATSLDLFTGLTGSPSTGGSWNDDDATGALSGNIFSPSIAGIGTYTFTYTVGGGTSTCPADTSTVTVTVSQQPNAGTFTGAQSICASAGTIDLLTLLTGNQAGGTFSDPNGTVGNPFDLTTVGPGTYNFIYTVTTACGSDTENVQFTILANPVLNNANVTVTAPVCLGSPALINFSGMVDGDYTINYTLSGANSGSQTIVLTIVDGLGIFMVNASALPNLGSTTITFNSIANNSNSCSTTLTGVSETFTVTELSNLVGATITTADVCSGNDVTVVISSAAGLPDGDYTFNYDIPGATPTAGSSDIVVISGGAGQFTVPEASFTTIGSFTITINEIVSLSGGCSNDNVSISSTFDILPLPDANGATIAAADVCVDVANQVSISGATNLPDGTYTISYELSGASNSTATATVIFTSGSASFEIPATELSTTGTVTVTITGLENALGCGNDGTLFNTITFAVGGSGTPVLEPNGNEFCSDDNPTIADLSANISGSQSVIWYTSATGGTALNATDLLQDGVQYFAEFDSSNGCATSTRLPVTVDLNNCPDDDIVIPDGFSPNEDSINDEFVIENLATLYPNFSLEVYNRYGNILYKGNRDTPNWNGTSSEGGVKIGNSVVPTGVYFFVIEFNDGARKPIQGRVYLSR
ncbi:MAG TPA: gliding motility-associated C-terminal domain-containing protein, partial [Flavobacterium sp.]